MSMDIPRTTPQSAEQAVARLLSESGFCGAENVGAARVFVRRVRPRWTIVLASLLALPTLGLGLLLLRVRTTDRCTVIVEPALFGARVHLTGSFPATLAERISEHLGLGTGAGLSTRASLNTRPLPRPEPDERIDAAAVDLALSAKTIITTPGPGAGPGDSYLLIPEWAPAVEVTSAGGVLGRDPRESEPGLRLVVEDPDRMVSKTHAAFGVDHRGFWIQDLDSTNGTTVTTATGTLIICEPDRRYYLAVGDRVRVGNRHFTVRQQTSPRGT
jgi:hypothetical protein